MPTLKQRTVGDYTYKLTKYPTDKPGKQYEYKIKAAGDLIDGPFYDKQTALQEFDRTCELAKRGHEKKQQQEERKRAPGAGTLQDALGL